MVGKKNTKYNIFYKRKKGALLFLGKTSIVFPIVFPDAFAKRQRPGKTDALRNDKGRGKTDALRNDKGRKRTLCETTKGGKTDALRHDKGQG